jgi:cell division protein FtsW (lipid II flippase)
MSTRTKFVIGGVVVGLLTFKILTWWIPVLIILGVLAVPVVAYLMLDPSQRRRVRAQGRKRIGS